MNRSAGASQSDQIPPLDPAARDLIARDREGDSSGAPAAGAGTGIDTEALLEALATWDECYRRGEDPPIESLGVSDSDLLARLRGRIEKLKRLYATLKHSENVDHPRDGALPAFPGHEILDKIGQGGMGVVYKARDLKLGRVVAIKTIGDSPHGSRGRLDRFRVEAEAVARLKHPNVIPIYTIGEHQGRPYYSLEFADGGNLARSVAERPMGSTAAAGLIEALAGAVHAAHLAGIVHRDLKPSNVLLTADGTPKISDFGVAKLADGDSVSTLTGETLGTPSYMAPEQAEGQSKAVGPAADVYALGAILYQSLTGKPPFLGQTAIETLKLVVSTDVVPPRRLRPDVPRDLETICLKCLEKIPEKRYAAAKELALDLGRFQLGEPVRARRIGPLGRLSKWTRRHPWQTALAATVLAGVSAFFTLVYQYNSRLRSENRRAEANAAEARRNYSEARSTISAMLGHFRDGRVAGAPGLVDLRRSQGEDALAFYDHILSQEDSSDPVVLADTIRALAEASQMQYAFGHRALAEQNIQRALRLISVLRGKHTSELELLGLEVDCLRKLGGYIEYPRRKDEARAIYEQVIPLAERLMSRQNGSPDSVDELAACHHTYAGILEPDRLDLAKVHLRKAIELRERPEALALPGMRYRLAQSEINLGVFLWQEKDYAHAESQFQKAQELLLAPENGAQDRDRSFTITLGQLNVNWAGMLWELQSYDQAIKRADGALGRLESYIGKEPHDQEARDICLKLHGNRAQALGAVQKHREAAADWARVVALSAPPVTPNYRVALALELLQSDERDRAVEQAQLARRADGLAASDLYNLGCVFSRAAREVQSDTSVNKEEQARRAASYVNDAVAALQKAAEAGFFRDPAVRDYAGKDPDLDFVRDRLEIRRLIAGSPSSEQPAATH
jgi:hypothetical protein